MSKEKKTFITLLILVLSMQLVSAQTNDSPWIQQPFAFIDSTIVKFTLASDLKNVSFNENDCTFILEFENRTIKAAIPDITPGIESWDVHKNDLRLILTSLPGKKAFYEVKNKAINQYFATLNIHFNADKIKNQPDFESKINDAVGAVIKRCAEMPVDR